MVPLALRWRRSPRRQDVFTDSGRDVLTMGGTMSKTLRLSLITTALLFSALTAWGQELPDGPGKELVAAQCNSCHPFHARLGGGYTPQGWRTVMRMMTNHGVAIPPDQLETMTAYLTKNFPEKAKPVGVVIPGPARVSMKEWEVPTPGSRPHDPLATRDGALWYTGQMNNVLGRVDPKTGKIREYSLKTPHAGPHGLDEDKNGTFGTRETTARPTAKLNPKTGVFTKKKMRARESKDPPSLTLARAE